MDKGCGKCAKGIIVVYKFDGANPEKGVEGNIFALYNERGKIEGELITDKNGFARTKFLQPGKYILVEIKSPRGYKRDKRPIRVTLEGKPINGVIYKKIFVCSKKLMQIDIKRCLRCKRFLMRDL